MPSDMEGVDGDERAKKNNKGGKDEMKKKDYGGDGGIEDNVGDRETEEDGRKKDDHGRDEELQIMKETEKSRKTRY